MFKHSKVRQAGLILFATTLILILPNLTKVIGWPLLEPVLTSGLPLLAAPAGTSCIAILLQGLPFYLHFSAIVGPIAT